MSRLLEGKRGLIFGVANSRSIAWGIAEACHREGAALGFTYLNDALAKRVIPLAESVGAELVLECDVQNDQHIDQVFAEVERAWGKIDFLVHSLAYAQAEDLKGPFHQTSREGFKLALDVSAYSLVSLTRKALPLMADGGSILALTYLGAQQVVPNYRLMGVAKAALEACVRELAVDVGQQQVRVNALSAGPIRTLAASGIADFRQLLANFEQRAPLKRNVTIEDCGNTALWLLSDLSSAVTGEIIFVDGGFHVTAA